MRATVCCVAGLGEDREAKGGSCWVSMDKEQESSSRTLTLNASCCRSCLLLMMFLVVVAAAGVTVSLLTLSGWHLGLFGFHVVMGQGGV